MRIQVLSQSFYPDHSGISLYSSEFAFYAAEKGHEVEVITGFGFYPHWKKQKKDRRKLFSTEYHRNVKILRGYIYVPENPTTFKRIIHETSLLTSALLNSFRAKKPDVIVVFTTPILLGFLTVLFKKVYNCSLVINVQDFQLEAASSLKMAKEKFLFNILSWLERFSYQNADLVTSISNSMYDILKNNKHLEEKKIALWPNWIQRKGYELDLVSKGKFRKEHNIAPGDIMIGYAGNIGLKQGLEMLVDLAERFKDNARLRFLIIGEGAAAPIIMKYAKSKKLSNIVFLPLLTSEEYKHFLNDLDLFFLPQKKTEFDVYFPSKLLGLMAAKKSIVVSADKESELYKTIRGNNIGYVTEYGDVDALAEIVCKLLIPGGLCNEKADNALSYVSQFERNKVLDKVLDKINYL